MRILKFRAWDKEKRKWRETNEMTLFSIFNSGRFDINQFTGLKDKEMKDIFDGDIIQATDINNTKFKIALWHWGLAGIKENGDVFNFNAPPYEENLAFDTVPNWKVIGNIYENPELFKGVDVA